jgi:hypothetical protein
MIKTEIIGGGSTKSALVSDTPFGHILLTTTPEKQYAHFKSSLRVGAGTTTVVQPTSGEAIALTDLLISAEKAAGNLDVRFTDGTNFTRIFAVPLTDAPASFGVSFAGKWMGWQDARIDMITDAAFNAVVAVGYIKVPSEHTLSYAEWDAAR